MTAAGPRYRIFEDSVNNQFIQYRSQSPAGTGPWTAWSQSAPAAPIYRNFDAMSDVVTPGFSKIIESGGIINNPMTRSKVNISMDRSGTYYGYGSFNSEIKGPGSLSQAFDAAYTFGGPNNSVDVAHLLKQTAQKVVAGIDSTPYRFLEDQLEFRKTLNTLRDPFQGAAELAESFAWKRQKLLRKGLDLVSATSGAWLKYRYAFRPIAISIKNIMNEYQDKVLAEKAGLPELGSFGHARRTSRAGDTGRSSMEGTYYSGPDPANRYSMWKSKEIHVDVRCGILYETSNPISSFAEANGLRLKDLPATLYNIVPYSWVLEHFVSVNKSIQGMVNLADPHIKVLAAWQVVNEKTISKKRLLTRNYPGFTYVIDGDIYTEETDTTYRNPWLPSFNDTLPVSNIAKANDAAFITDLASLVVKRLSPPLRKVIG